MEDNGSLATRAIQACIQEARGPFRKQAPYCVYEYLHKIAAAGLRTAKFNNFGDILCPATTQLKRTRRER